MENVKSLSVLIAFECSGVVREAFRAQGHNAYSCDLKPAEDGSPYHIQDDVFNVIGKGWDLLIAHPPCTYLCSSGLHWNGRTPGRQAKTDAALDMVRALMSAPVDRIAIENPVGCISTQIRKADQYIQPYDYGDDASKRTGLWLKGLPKLEAPTGLRVPGRKVTKNGITYERWSNQTDSGQNRLGPGINRATDRARTYKGIAAAMAEQWK